MGSTSSSNNQARLEAQISPEIGANSIPEECLILKLGLEDSRAFVAEILNPPVPNEALRAAATRYQKKML